MKVLLISALLMGFSTGALAAWDDEQPPGSKVQYDSWCEGDVVKMENRDGQVISAWDCSEISESARCVEQALKKGDWTIITATCE
jgi:hypothetical protein